MGHRSRLALLAGAVAIVVGLVGCSKFDSGTRPTTGSAGIDSLCSFFSPGAGLPNDKLRVFEGVESGAPGGEGTVPTGDVPVGVAVSLLRIGDGHGDLDADVAAFNEALDRIGRGDPPAEVAQAYRPAGDAFAAHLSARCGPVWESNEGTDGD